MIRCYLEEAGMREISERNFLNLLHFLLKCVIMVRYEGAVRFCAALKVV